MLQLQLKDFQKDDTNFKLSDRIHLLTSFLPQLYLPLQMTNHSDLDSGYKTQTETKFLYHDYF